MRSLSFAGAKRLLESFGAALLSDKGQDTDALLRALLQSMGKLLQRAKPGRIELGQRS